MSAVESLCSVNPNVQGDFPLLSVKLSIMVLFSVLHGRPAASSIVADKFHFRFNSAPWKAVKELQRKYIEVDKRSVGDSGEGGKGSSSLLCFP